MVFRCHECKAVLFAYERLHIFNKSAAFWKDGTDKHVIFIECKCGTMNEIQAKEFIE